MTQFNVHDAKSNLSRLIERALAGETVIIARRGKPAVRLAPVKEEAFGQGQTPFERLAGSKRGQIREIDPDWWKPDDELADLFEGKERPDDLKP
jgi:prevent-host-death family protein